MSMPFSSLFFCKLNISAIFTTSSKVFLPNHHDLDTYKMLILSFLVHCYAAHYRRKRSGICIPTVLPFYKRGISPHLSYE
jgi:hypothetical protein